MPVLVPAAADEVIPLNRLRAAIGRRMAEAKQQVPHFYVTHEYDMAAVMELRKQVNALLPENEKISVNDFILKAAALTLRQFPNLNAAFQGDKVLRHGQVNVGVAVAVEGGLLTVVNKDTDRKPVRQIAQKCERWLRAPARAKFVRKISRARRFRSATWGCMMWSISSPLSTHLKLVSWQLVQCAKCR